jgi:hypothetical protein
MRQPSTPCAGQLVPVRELTRDEIADVVDVYNALADRWDETELDRSKPLWSEWNGLAIGSIWGRRGPRHLALYLNFCGLVIHLKTPRWTTWKPGDLFGKPWLRRRLKPEQVRSAIAYASGPTA